MGPRASKDECIRFQFLPGFDLRTAQPVASRYTGLHIPVHIQRLLYFLQAVLYRYGSCAILKPIHYHCVQPKTQTQQFSLRSHEKQRRYCQEFILIKFVAFLGFDRNTFPLAKLHRSKSYGIGSVLHSVGPPRPIYRTVKWLSSHVRTGSAKYVGAGCHVTCTSLSQSQW